MAASKNGGPSGVAMPTKKGAGPGTLRGRQKPPDNVIAPINTGKGEIRLSNKNGFGSVFRDRENKPMRKTHVTSFGGG
jgi:hypothetical protein